MIIDERYIAKLPGMNNEEALRFYELYVERHFNELERFNFDTDSMRGMIMVSNLKTSIKQSILIKMHLLEKKYCHD